MKRSACTPAAPGVSVAGIALTSSGGSLNVPAGIIVGGQGIRYPWSPNYIGFAWTGGGIAGYVDGASQGWVLAPSDRRVKRNIGPVEADCLGKVNALAVKAFSYTKEIEDSMGRKRHLAGLIAQEVIEVMPEAVQGDSSMSLEPTALIAYVIGAIQQLATRLEALEARMAT